MRESRFTTLILVMFLLFLSLPLFSYGSVEFEDDRLSVVVYVLNLDGVDAMGVHNFSKVIEGVKAAIRAVNDNKYTYEWQEDEHLGTLNAGGKYTYWWSEDPLSGFAKLEIPVNVSLHVLSDWNAYKDVVETSVESIVVNAHGEIVPIPARYTKEAWTDKIGEGMLYRNLTWVHAGGYPFYYYWDQENGFGIWREQGFQELMTNLDKPNATCNISRIDEIDSRTGQAKDSLGDIWGVDRAKFVSRDYPIKETDFEDKIVLRIWGEQDYYSGAIVAFKKLENQSSHGFYVHLGTNQTYDDMGDPTERDFTRSYIGCAAGLWALLARTVAEFKISEAESAIQNAVDENRTQSLTEAIHLLDEARMSFASYFYDSGTLVKTYRAIVKAGKAQKPPPGLLEQPILFSIIILGAVIVAGGLIIERRHNSSRNDKYAVRD